MPTALDIAWSDKVDEADWIRERLAGRVGSVVTSVMPGDFEAYARVLHPARRTTEGAEELVRWGDVAAWSGTPLRDSARFHSVALPPERPVGSPVPYDGAPRRGTLDAATAAAVAEVLRGGTTTPDDCWFGLWDGYGWLSHGSDVIPEEVLRGERARLPGRDYVLYRGAVEGAAAFVGAQSQTANLWWPADRAWYVASEVDLPWTYVAGSEATVRRLGERSDLEVLPAAADDKLWRVEDWVARWVYLAVTELLAAGFARVETSRGAVSAWLERPGLTPGALDITVHADGGTKSSSRVRVEHRVESELRQRLSLHLTLAVINLVEG